MSDVVIKVENLSKKYILSHQSQERYTALRDVMSNGVKNLGKKLLSPFTPSTSFGSLRLRSGQDAQDRSLRAGLHSSQSSDSPFTESEDFYALRDVSFEIKQGDRVGIIGRNGAGKSTLLKILSRITEPTSGRIEITGRVASLLEVGTGFHPELTGRENIFLNGAILGMGRAEIKRKFDEIVAFAEVEKFLDTPVKRYSSGMYVRLAFAVAAHLEPEILIVDEVLAVGDAQFQKKCLGKMEEVGREGRTVLFVSHNMATIKSLCPISILLDDGRIKKQGETDNIISNYLIFGSVVNGNWYRNNDIPISNGIYFLKIRVLDHNYNTSGNIDASLPFYIEISVHATCKLDDTQIAFRITNQEGIHVFTSANTDEITDGFITCEKGIHNYRVQIPKNFLKPGMYSILAASMVPAVILYESIEDKVSFYIEDYGNHATKPRETRLGVVSPKLTWERTVND